MNSSVLHALELLGRGAAANALEGGPYRRDGRGGAAQHDIAIGAHLELDFAVRRDSGLFADRLRNGDLAFAGDSHGRLSYR